MSAGLETLDHSNHVAHQWIKELDEVLGWQNKPRSYRLLRAVLQTLRDCLQLGEMADLAAQLPQVLRGAYYEHWRPAAVSEEKRWNRDRFFAQIDESFRNDPIGDVGDAVSAVFALLSSKISAGEIRDVIGCLPADIRSLWRA